MTSGRGPYADLAWCPVNASYAGLIQAGFYSSPRSHLLSSSHASLFLLRTIAPKPCDRGLRPKVPTLKGEENDEI